MKPILAAALAAATALTAASAVAGSSTTVIRQYKAVVPDRPTQTVPAPATRTTQVRRVVHKTAVRRARTHHILRRVAAPTQPSAASAAMGSVDTSATVREDSDMPASAYRPSDSGAVMEERKTVIRRDDDGNVSRHTRIIRQDPEGGMTAVEHRSSDGPDADTGGDYDGGPDRAP
jgi:hypothetical protein